MVINTWKAFYYIETDQNKRNIKSQNLTKSNTTEDREHLGCTQTADQTGKCYCQEVSTKAKQPHHRRVTLLGWSYRQNNPLVLTMSSLSHINAVEEPWFSPARVITYMSTFNTHILKLPRNLLKYKYLLSTSDQLDQNFWRLCAG